MLADSYVTESALPESGPAQRRPRLSISITSAVLPPPFDCLPPFVLTPRPPRPPFASAQHTYQTVHLHPLLGFAYVRPVCQPVLLTDVRIDNLCPLIMTVRSRARRYLTVRVIAISSSMLCLPTNRDRGHRRHRSSTGNFRLNPERNPPGIARLKVSFFFSNASVSQE